LQVTISLQKDFNCILIANLRLYQRKGNRGVTGLAIGELVGSGGFWIVLLIVVALIAIIRRRK